MRLRRANRVERHSLDTQPFLLCVLPDSLRHALVDGSQLNPAVALLGLERDACLVQVSPVDHLLPALHEVRLVRVPLVALELVTLLFAECFHF